MSLNTLKSLANPHTIRGIATLKDVERFRKGDLERRRESIVKLTMKMPIVKLKLCIQKRIIIKLIQTLKQQSSTTECEQRSTEEKTRIASGILSEEDSRLATCVYSQPDSK